MLDVLDEILVDSHVLEGLGDLGARVHEAKAQPSAIVAPMVHDLSDSVVEHRPTRRQDGELKSHEPPDGARRRSGQEQPSGRDVTDLVVAIEQPDRIIDIDASLSPFVGTWCAQAGLRLMVSPTGYHARNRGQSSGMLRSGVFALTAAP